MRWKPYYNLHNFIEDKVRKRLNGWKEKTLSQAGREILIKSVIQALPSYIMQCFTLPVSICSNIESMTKRFWWSNSNKHKPVYWKAWKDLCMRKQEGGMGFWELRSFNLALLAKQGWRLIQRPDSLVSQVLKSKYFSNTTFMKAKLGPRPSYLWRSILDGKQVLELGVRQRVGDGATIRIWDDRWIPKPTGFMAVPLNKSRLPEGKVSDLIDADLMCWNEALLQELFLPYDVSEILRIPLSRHGGPDRTIWHHSKTGAYTVKSGHHVWQATERRLREQTAASSSNVQSAFWTKLWNLPLQPKIRIFAWRTAVGTLATKVNLCRRRLSEEMSCPLCWYDYEDDIHCLLGCRWLADFWSEFLLTIPFSIDESTSIRDIYERLLADGAVEHACQFISGCWVVWRNRCSMVFEEESRTISQLKSEWNYILSATSDWQAAPVLPNPQTPLLATTWQQPQMDTISVNVDAAFGKNGDAACGIIIRNWMGEIISCASLKLPKGIDVSHGECMAIMEGLRLITTRGDAKVEVWSDSLSSVQGFNGAIDDLHPLASIMLEGKALVQSLDYCRIGFVRRNGNHPAHLLAKLGLLIEYSTSWGRNPPHNVCIAVENDLC